MFYTPKMFQLSFHYCRNVTSLGPKCQSLGPMCPSRRTEMSWCRSVLDPKCMSAVPRQSYQIINVNQK